MFVGKSRNTLALLSVLSVCVSFVRAGDRQIEAPISGREIQYGNYSSYSASDSRAAFTAPAAAAPAGAPSHEDPVFTSRSPTTHPYNPPRSHHGGEGGYGGKKPDSRSIAIDKSPPELQFGLSFTVPFISLSTDKLLSTISGKSFGDSSYGDMASLLKLNVGGLVVAAVVGIAALFFVPSLFPGKFANLFSGGGGGGGGFPYGFMPNIMEHILPGMGFAKPLGYGQYDTNPFPDPYANDYNNNGQYKNEDGYDGRGRSLKGRSVNQTDFFSQVRHVMKAYMGNVEGCAAQAMCLQGQKALEEQKLKAKEEKSSRRGRRLEGKEGEEGLLSSFEHVLEAVNGMKRITKQAPIVAELRNAYTAGKKGVDCVKEYKSCPVTSDRVANTIQNVGNYIFNS